MKHFTIDAENNIRVHASRKTARDAGAVVFATEEQFADLIGPDNKRLVDIWNSLPGVKPTTKFSNRKVATERIWRVVQELGKPTAGELAPETGGGTIGAETAQVEVSAAEPSAKLVEGEPRLEAGTPPAGNESGAVPVADQARLPPNPWPPLAHSRPTLRRRQPSRVRRLPSRRDRPNLHLRPRVHARVARQLLSWNFSSARAAPA
jgi:hypothetical protein